MTASTLSLRDRVDPHAYYKNWAGHLPDQLRRVHQHVIRKKRPGRGVVWLVGDSTMDNKHWVKTGRKAGRRVRHLNGYESVMSSPEGARPDVAHCVNAEILDRGVARDHVCINGAVEASTICDRTGAGSLHPQKGGELYEQDEFVRDHMRPNDTLVVSVGGNDIANEPTARTVLAAFGALLSSTESIERGTAPGIAYFKRLFGDATVAYARQIIARCKPRRIVLCTLYHLDENPDAESWAGAALKLLRYDANPARLQTCIRAIHAHAHKPIGAIDGVEVVAVPLFEAMDGKDTRDYAHRVEPSARGGAKMAAAIMDAVLA